VTGLRILVFGSPGYDDEPALRAALDELFDKAPMAGDLVVLAGVRAARDPRRSPGPGRRR